MPNKYRSCFTTKVNQQITINYNTVTLSKLIGIILTTNYTLLDVGYSVVNTSSKLSSYKDKAFNRYFSTLYLGIGAYVTLTKLYLTLHTIFFLHNDFTKS